MISSKLAMLALTGLLSSVSLATFAAQPTTGPTNPVQEPKPPQLPGGINSDNDSVIKNGALPPVTASTRATRATTPVARAA
ncbi:hypothetical protein PHLH7_18030 [Pseudomonas sp. Ost2]|uniref:hypothetical protein n=1 Tax=Pseudomonas sp. Ost2 TaxID=2678260 RepID=UPI001BEDFF95|nr:hypothetical protein [Pseudomonas sp. Ost2]BBP75699.1 hypothetical protein PHLH7_18030 [Pseudomonas sp. Ost2]